MASDTELIAIYLFIRGIMNKIFKVIFNRATGKTVVVSELTKANGKSASQTDERARVGLLNISAVTTAAAVLLGASSMATAGTGLASGTAAGDRAIAIGERSTAPTSQSIAFGFQANASGAQSVALGADTKSEGKASIAIGGDDADGTSYQNWAYNAAQGKVVDTGSTQYQGTIANGGASIAIGTKAQAMTEGSVATGVLATAAGTEAVALGAKSSSKGTRSVALGAGSTASGNQAFAGGDGSVASANSTIAIGSSANASSVNATAVGVQAKAIGENATSLGMNASSEANTVAIGANAIVQNSGGVGGLALGKGANASGTGASALGTSAVANGTYATAYGDTTKVYADRAIAIGLASNITAGSTNSTLLGSHATIGANSVRAVSIGSNNNVTSANATALGSGITIASGFENSVVLGANSGTGGSHAIANVTGATVNGVSYSGFAGGVNSTGNFVSVGTNATGGQRKIINVAAGNVSATSTEAINGSQLYMVANELKNQIGTGGSSSIRYFSVNSTHTANRNNNGATAYEAVAIGPNATAAGNQSIAIGLNSTAANGSTNTIAIGRNANASADSGTAIGNAAHSTQDSAAYGVLANASALRTTAIGPVARALAGNATAVGNEAIANATFATAIGDKAIANVSNGVALGSGSVANRDVPTTSGYDVSTGAASTDTSTTWRANTAAVSVGNSTNTRQIVNVAAGSEDTDAVNVAQLKKVTANAASATRAYNFTIANGEAALANTTGTADNWTLSSDDTLSFGATSNLSVTTDGAGKIVYDLSSTFTDKINNIETTANAANTTANAANTTANAANTTANAANATANTANATANDANATANTANATANDANATANTANATANTANNTANTAQAGVDALNARKYTFNVKNNANAQTANDGQAQEWQLNADNNVTFGATSYLNVTTDAAGNIIYDLSESSKTALNAAGAGADGKDGSSGTAGAAGQGLTGKDGLNGKDLTTKVNALRNGEAGPVVYTDADGNRLVKANDGKYYPADQVEDNGEPKADATPEANPIASVVNPDGSTTAPTTMGNVKSTIGLNGKDATGAELGPIDAAAAKDAVAGTDGKSGLLAKKGAELNNVATVGDLQAIAQAGLDFTGNNAAEDKDVHRPLGTKLTIEGETTKANQTKADFGATAANNIHVESKGDENKLVISLTEDLKGINSVDFKPAEITNPDGSKTYAKANISSKGNTYVETDKDGVAKPDGKTAEYGLNGSELADGTGNVTTTTPEGVTVKDADGKEATYGADGIGLKGADGNTTTIGTDDNGNLTVTNGKDGADAKPQTLVTSDNIASMKGTDGRDGKDGTDATSAGAQGLTGKDGLNGASLDDKINALRNGEAGPVVYTDAAGNRLVKANDGQYYPAAQVGEDGEPLAGATPEANPIASVVNPDGSTTAPTTMGNVKSTIGLNGKDADGNDLGPIEAADAKKAVAGEDGQSGLLAKKGAELNNAATVGDLQAIAQAGLDFTGNNAAEDKDVHRPLGTKLTIEGETTKANQTKADFGATAANNIHVESKGDENKLVISLTEDLKGINSVDFKPAEITNPDGSKTYAKANISSKGNTYVETDKDGVAKPDGKTAEYGLNGATVTEKDPATGETKTTTMDADGTHATVKDKDGNPTKSADYTADGSTVKAVDPTTGEAKESTYGADGLSTKALDKDGNVTGETTVTPEGVNLYGKDGKDGKDAEPVASLTNKVDADGKNNPSLDFAKDGDNGTGSITGLKDLERNPDGTAKDKTAAANAGYVDDRLAEMDAGKPFEYFTKDADGNDVKVVRGKDGNFYTEAELAGKTYDPTTNSYKDADGNEVKPTVDSADVTIKAMPNTNEMALGNIKSTIGLNGKDADGNDLGPIEAADAKKAVAGEDGQSGLLAKKGAELNNAATVGDLQAIAQAGLDFTGNNAAEDKDVHRPLGTKLTIEGETTKANQTKADFGATAANNIHVESKGDENKLVISLTEDLKGINSVDFKPAEITNPDGSKTYAKANISSKGNTYVETDKDGVAKPDGKTAEYGLNGATVTEKDPATGETKTTTMDADGTHATVKDKDGKPTKSADYTADGSTVKAVDPTTGEAKESTYGADGLSTKALDKDGNVTSETTVTPEGVNLYGKDGKDGKDAEPVASLTNKVDADGKNNPSLDFAKDGDNGTGSITGLKDLERNPDGTAKDKTAAANAGYVDDRLAEMDAGKPFEYFTKDADGNDVKVVRGKDGNFYDPKALEGKVYDPDTKQYYPAKADGTADTAQTPAEGKPASEVVIKAMPNEAGPVAMGNVGSGLGLDAYNGKPGADGKTVPAKYDATNADDVKAAQGAADKLYALDGDKLNNVVTAGDLQALAVAGLDFTGNNNATKVHRALGSKLTVEGEGAWNGQNSAADNLYVQADAANNKLVVKMNENLTGINSVDFKPTEITNPDGSKTYAKSTISSAGNTYVETDKDGKAVPNGKSATYGLNGSTLADGKGNVTNMTAAGTNVVDAAGNSANYGANGSTVADAAGNTANYGANGSTVTDVAGNTANYGANGSIVTDVAGNTANYGANGLTVADKDGNPAITLVNNASGPSLNFATDANGNGTGKITGVAAGDITPNSSDVVTGAQLYQLTGGNTIVNNANGTTTSTAKGLDGKTIMTTDENGNQVEKQYTLTTYNVEGQTEFVTNSVITAVHNMNEQGIKFFHTNDGVAEPINQASNSVDSSASGSYATAVGYQAKADGTNAIAMGKGATATGENSIAIGTGNQVEASKSGAFGDPNIIMGKTSDNVAVSGSYAIGNDNVINSSNTFVLGNDVNNRGNENGKPVAMGDTVENSVYLGNKTTATAGDGSKTGTLKNRKQDGSEGTTTTAGSTGTVSSAKVGNMTYGGFAGAKADGVVSVGAAGNERRVQNVAAGEISATSTDAINGSQLYSVAKGVDQLDGKVNRMNRKLRSGIAAATAMTNIPQVTMPGKSALGAGVGSYDGQGALAVGYSRMSDSGRVIFKVSAGATTQGKYNAGAGVALQW